VGKGQGGERMDEGVKNFCHESVEEDIDRV
jgi:hypothetical protein